MKLIVTKKSIAINYYADCKLPISGSSAWRATNTISPRRCAAARVRFCPLLLSPMQLLLQGRFIKVAGEMPDDQPQVVFGVAQAGGGTG